MEYEDIFLGPEYMVQHIALKEKYHNILREMT